jgi:hypothetical protein
LLTGLDQAQYFLQAMPEEYYVREPDAETARGPFNLDKLITLAEAGQVGTDTLYYDPKMQAWATIASNPRLKEEVFPAKRKLILKPKGDSEINNLNADEGSIPAVSVSDMLAAAEGKSSDTKHVKNEAKWRERAASMAIPVIGLMMILSAVSQIYPGWEVLRPWFDSSYEQTVSIWKNPLVIVGIVDLVLAFLVLLSMTEIFPLLRFRAMLGLGYFGFMSWAAYINDMPGALMQLVGILCFCIGLFLCTLTMRYKFMVLGAVMGIGGIVLYMWLTSLAPLWLTLTEK